MSKRTPQERVKALYDKSARCLITANRFNEKGDKVKAELWYERSTQALMAYNELSERLGLQGQERVRSRVANQAQEAEGEAGMTNQHPRGAEGGAPAIVGRVREVSRLHGWAIGCHGTMERDYDLIAVPWTDDASSMRVWFDALCLILNLRSIDGQEGFVLPKGRAHGRRTFLLNHPDAEYMRPGPGHKGWWDPPTLDLSIIDPREMQS